MGIAARLVTEKVGRKWVPTTSVEQMYDDEGEIVIKVSIPTDLSKIFKKRKTREDIMKATNIVLYSVIIEKTYATTVTRD